jgi:hypothetical protein
MTAPTRTSHPDFHRRLLQVVAIPAMPLALTAARKLDERRQRALCRYYIARRRRRHRYLRLRLVGALKSWGLGISRPKRRPAVT